MKNPDYVFNVVRCYRVALDAVAAGHTFDADALVDRLARSFNRGFSEEYLMGRSGAALMSFERACNQGVRVGRLVACGRGEVTVELSAAVAAGDTLEIRFYPGENALPDVPKRWPMVPCPVDAAAGERIAVHCKRKVEVGCEVYVTRDVAVLDEAARALEAARAEEAGLNAALIAAGEARASRGSGCAGEVGALSVTWDPSRGISQAGRPDGLGGDDGTLRVPVAMTPAEAERLLAQGEMAAYAWAIEDDPDGWAPLLPRLTVLLDEMLRAGDAERVLNLAGTAARVVCRNIGQVELVRRLADVRFDVGAPVFIANGRTAGFLASLGAERLWLPDEWGCDLESRVPTVRPAGARQLMALEHCLLTAEGACDGECALCERRHGVRYLVDKRDGARHRVYVDRAGRTRIFE